MGGLAQCFVRASAEAVDPQSQQQSQQSQARTSQHGNSANSMSSSSPDSLELRAKQRRMREETMANVTTTIVGVTERLLQLPELGVRIPDKLSPYGNPEVVSRILDAGLYAYSHGMVDANGVPRAVGEPITNEQRVEAFSARNNSALLHSLGLVADLMTLDANVYRDDDGDIGPTDFGQGAGIRPVSIGVGKPMGAHKGPGPSIIAAYAAAKAEANERHQASKPKPLPELADKKAGDPIVETTALQRELALRFPRLSEMFGPEDDGEAIPSDHVLPLGSLRLKVAEFFVACMKNSSQDTVDQIMGLGVPKKLLKLFSKYQWSSMLHGVITKSIVNSLDAIELGRSSRKAWFEAGVIPWLIESWSLNAKAEEEEKNSRRRSRAGYMGHLIRIGTALRFFIEVQKDEGHESSAEMPEQSQLDAFSVFATEALSPAQELEITPLCDDQEDEAEATDLLEMGGIGFSDHFGDGSGTMHISLMQNPPRPGDDIVDEEEEIKPVDVDDLEQFAADDEDARHAKPVDHDIPLAMRARFAKEEEEEVEVVKPITDPIVAEDSSKPRAVSRESSRDRSQKAYMSKLHEPRDVELEQVIDTVDSSSDEEGSYEAFVDTQIKSLSETTEKFSKLKVVDNEPGSASLDGAVTEIEEETLPLGTDSNLMQLASNVISVVDDAADSSDDEEYVEWNDTGRVDELRTSPQSTQRNEPEKGMSRESSAR
ncbi:SIT4 phosphatase-associated protein [Gracilaria domingensis]|nr:SIT4 phosphatase-associated protein [Gracilaria domingensis]